MAMAMAMVTSPWLQDDQGSQPASSAHCAGGHGCNLLRLLPAAAMSVCRVVVQHVQWHGVKTA
jgi:hypothetical protein